MIGFLAIQALSYLRWSDRWNEGRNAGALVEHLSDAALADADAYYAEMVEDDSGYDVDAEIAAMIRAEIARRSPAELRSAPRPRATGAA